MLLKSIYRGTHGLRQFFPTSIGNALAKIGARDFINMPVLLALCVMIGALAIAGILINVSLRPYHRVKAIEAKFFRELGEILIGMFGFVLLPLPRHSFLSAVFGISFESVIKFHRIMGSAIYIFMGIHGFGMWVNYAKSNMMSYSTSFDFVFQFMFDPNTGYSNLSGFLAFIFCTITVVAAYSKVRRWYYEYFYYIHITAATLTFGFAIAHMTMIIYWMIPYVAFSIIDLSRRYHNYFAFKIQAKFIPIVDTTTTTYNDDNTVKHITTISNDKSTTTTTTTTTSTQVTKIEIDITHLNNNHFKTVFTNYLSGQYYMITIPQLSMIESHPFSISSPKIILPSGEDCTYTSLNQDTVVNKSSLVSFHILNNQLSNSWTSKLYELATHNKDKNGVDTTLEIRLDGPFGSAFNSLSDHETIVFCCGGIGATPAMSMIADILNEQKYDSLSHNNYTNNCHNIKKRWSQIKEIHLIWSSKDVALFIEFQSVLLELTHIYGPNVVHLYCTHSSSKLSSFLLEEDKNLSIKNGRPDFQYHLNNIITTTKTTHSRGVGIMICGPITMIDDIRSILVDNSYMKKHSRVYNEDFYF